MLMRPPRSPPTPRSPSASLSSPHSLASAVTPLRSGSDPTPASPISPLIFPTLAPGCPAYPSTLMPKMGLHSPEPELPHEPSQTDAVTPERKKSTLDNMTQASFQTPERMLLKSQEVARLKKLVMKSPRTSPYRSVSVSGNSLSGGSPESRSNETPGRLGAAPISVCSPISLREERNVTSGDGTTNRESHRSLFTSSKQMVSLRGQALLKRRYGSKVGLFQRSSGSFNEAIGKPYSTSSGENASPNSVIPDGEAKQCSDGVIIHSSVDAKESVSRVLFQHEDSNSPKSRMQGGEKEDARDSSPFKNASRLLRSGSTGRSRRGLGSRKSESKAQLFQKMMKSPLSSRGFGAGSKGSDSSRQASCGGKGGGSKFKKFPTISELCAAVVPIQALGRRYLAKKALVKRRWAIVKVQTCIRQWGAVGEYKSTRTSVMRVQSLQRGIIARKAYRELCQLVHLVVTIQKVHRGSILRGKIAIQHEAATAIQSRARKMLACEQYVSMVSSIMIIQAVARMLPQRKKFQSHLREKREAIEKESAAIAIQSRWRSHACRHEYILTICDVIVVQSLVRRWANARRAEVKLIERNAAIVIQSRSRGSSAKRQYDRMLENVLRCQCLLRMWRAVRCVKNMKANKREAKEHQAAITIESAWRCLRTRKEYVITVGDLILCQSIVRKYLSAQSVKQLRRQRRFNDAATLIQSKFQLFRHERSAAATRIQATWRSFSTMDMYLQTILDVVAVQSLARRWAASKQYEEMKLAQDAAIVISSSWRGFMCRSEYEKTLADVTTCQSICRRNMAAAHVKQLRYEKKQRGAAVAIQSRWRAHAAHDVFTQIIFDLVMAQVQLLRDKRSAAASKIQVTWRSFSTLKKNQRAILQNAATVISSSWRGFVCRSEYEQTLADVTTCQSVCRRNMAVAEVKQLRHDKRENAAVAIQSKWRARAASDAYLLMLVDIILVQSVARRFIAHKSVARLQEEIEFNAATTISSTWRRHTCLRQYRRTVSDIITCQSTYRRNAAKKQAQWLLQTRNEEACAGFIQDIWRAYMTRERFVRVVCNMERPKNVESKSATEIASAWRAFNAQQKYASTVKDVTLCQTVIRRNFATKEVKFFKVRVCMTAAVVIQSKWRSWILSKRFRQFVLGLTSIQRLIKKRKASKYLLQVKMTKLFDEVALDEMKSATTIASTWRRFCCQRQYKHNAEASKQAEFIRLESIIRIQSAWRCHVAKTQFNNDIAKIIRIQALTRKLSAWRYTEQLLEERCRVRSDAAINVQAAWRCYVAKTKFRQMVVNITTIQALARRFAAKQIIQQFAQEKFVVESDAAKKIASFARCFIAQRNRWIALKSVVICQSLVRRKFAADAAKVLQHQRQSDSVVLIQSYWRTYAAKTKFHSLCSSADVIQKKFAVASSRCTTSCAAADHGMTDELISDHQKRQNTAAVKIQAVYRQHRCTMKWSRTIRATIKCQSIIRMWRAVACAYELRGYRNQGPTNIFTFIKTRRKATTKIQKTYQDYTTRNFDQSYQDYLLRLNHSIEKSTEDEIVKKVSFCEPAVHEICEPAVHEMESQSRDLNEEICDLYLEEEVLEETPIHTPEVSAESEHVEYAVDEDDEILESQCFDGSRCGFNGGVHEVLMVSGKFLYECLGEPDDETQENLLTVMEIGEEAAFCCWKKKPATDDVANNDEVTVEERDMEESAVVIQSKWRSCAASKDYNRTMEELQFAKQPSKSHALQQERAIVRFQIAVRAFLASKCLTKSSNSKVTEPSPVRKHVAKTGHIETLLNELDQDDASLTDYSETESSIGMMSDIYEGSINVA